MPLLLLSSRKERERERERDRNSRERLHTFVPIYADSPLLVHQGIRNVPLRVRVKLARQRNDDEEAREKMYTLVTHVEVDSFKGLQTKAVKEDAE